MKEKIEAKLAFLKSKKEEYVAQVCALNGAIQALEELLQGENNATSPRDEESVSGCSNRANELDRAITSRPDEIQYGPSF